MNPAPSAISSLDARQDVIFGLPTDPMRLVEQRAEKLLPGLGVVAWEVDATSFRFQYVGASAVRVLGYPVERWLSDPAFWEREMIHPDDAAEVVATLALAIGQGKGHAFSFRAFTADGIEIPFYAVTRTILSPRGVATEVRGVMVAVREPRREGFRSKVMDRLAALAGRLPVRETQP